MSIYCLKYRLIVWQIGTCLLAYTCSIGLAISTEDSKLIESLLNAADRVRCYASERG